MARKQQATGIKRIRYGYVKAWRNPHVKLLHVVILAAVFGWLGYHVLSSKAQGPVPTGADEIVVQYDPIDGYQAAKRTDGTIVNLLPPGEVIVTGDGSLYCNTSGNGSVTEGNIGLGVVKQLYNDLNAPDARNVAAAQHAQAPDYTTADEHAATLTVHGNASSWALSSVGESSGVFTRLATMVQHKCQGEYATHTVTSLPAFQDVGSPDAQTGLASWLMPQASALSSSYSSSETQTMITLTNNHRASHYRLPALYDVLGGTCLFKHYMNGAYYGAEIWTIHEAAYQAVSHDPNLAREVNVCSGGHWDVTHYGYDGKWWAYGQNSGAGPSATAIFNAYLNSCEHHVNIDDRSITWNGISCYSVHAGYNRASNAVNIDSSGRRWTVTSFSGY